MTRPDDLDGEAPEADVAEQGAYADPGDVDLTDDVSSRGLEVPEWDAQEQSQAVPLDEDYR
jgi:hypothetical protein